MSRRLAVVAAVALALALAGIATEWGDEEEHPCSVSWSATDAEYKAHVQCERAITRNSDRSMP